jgi:hypothetical protein
MFWRKAFSIDIKVYELLTSRNALSCKTYYKANAKLSYYRSGQALRAPGGWSSQKFLGIRHMNVVKLSSILTRSLYPLLFPRRRHGVPLRFIIQFILFFMYILCFIVFMNIAAATACPRGCSSFIQYKLLCSLHRITFTTLYCTSVFRKFSERLIIWLWQ